MRTVKPSGPVRFRPQCPELSMKPLKSMPLPAFGVLIIAIVYFLKLWSYAHANRWYRDEAIRNSREQMRRRGSRRIRSLSVPSIREIDDEETKMGTRFDLK